MLSAKTQATNIDSPVVAHPCNCTVSLREAERPPFSFLVKGLFFPSGPFSLIEVRSFKLQAKSFLLLAKFFF